MPGIAVEIVIDAPISAVWEDVSDIASHVHWMQDAESIRFLSGQTSGVGTRFECETVVGPLRLNDTMEVTEWSRGHLIGVRHRGHISGSGVFTLTPRGSATIFSWVEQLEFPWYLGGPVASSCAAPVLRSLWKRNLRRLKARLEDPSVANDTA